MEVSREKKVHRAWNEPRRTVHACENIRARREWERWEERRAFDLYHGKAGIQWCTVEKDGSKYRGMYYKDWRLVTLQFLYLIFRKDLYVVIIGKGYFRVIIVRIFFLCFSNVDSTLHSRSLARNFRRIFLLPYFRLLYPVLLNSFKDTPRTITRLSKRVEIREIFRLD